MRKLLPFDLRLTGLAAATRHFRGLVIVPVLAMMLAFPASAQSRPSIPRPKALVLPAPLSSSTSTKPNKN